MAKYTHKVLCEESQDLITLRVGKKRLRNDQKWWWYNDPGAKHKPFGKICKQSSCGVNCPDLLLMVSTVHSIYSTLGWENVLFALAECDIFIFQNQNVHAGRQALPQRLSVSDKTLTSDFLFLYNHMILILSYLLYSVFFCRDTTAVSFLQNKEELLLLETQWYCCILCSNLYLHLNRNYVQQQIKDL